MLRTSQLSASKAVGREALSHVRNVELAFEPESLTLICGDDGCGKNLLLRLLGLLEEPDSGAVFLDETNATALPEPQKIALRNEQFGFLLSSPFLLPAFTIIENVAMPLFKIHPEIPVEEAREQSLGILALVGLGDHFEDEIDELPIYAHYCAALARAVIHRPRVLILENIGAELANDERLLFAELLRNVSAITGVTTLITAPHEFLPGFADRTLKIVDGRVHSDSQTTAP